MLSLTFCIFLGRALYKQSCAPIWTDREEARGGGGKWGGGKRKSEETLLMIVAPAALRILCLLVLVVLQLPVGLMLCRSPATKPQH